MARLGSRAAATEESLRHNNAVQRKYLVAHEHGEAYWSPLGLHPIGGKYPSLQAGPRGLFIGSRSFRLKARGSYDGRRARTRSTVGPEIRTANSLCPPSARA